MSETSKEFIPTPTKASQVPKSNSALKRAKNYWRMLGPGLTTGASDDDPSGIATYSQTGALYGFQLLWLSVFTFPLMAIVQEMCARIGLVTGQGLAANIRHHFPRPVLYGCTILLFAANTFNLGADLGAMAKATQLLIPSANFLLLVALFTVLCLVLQIFTTYEKYARYLKYLALILVAYIFATLLVPNLDWGKIFQSIISPSITFSKGQLILICAILGTTISPYLFFWQTSQEVEEEILKGKDTLKLRQEDVHPLEIKRMRIDVWSGMFFSNLIMFFIITACAATLFASGATINTAADAANALRPLAGDASYLLFAIGIIGTGLLAVPVLAGSASYAISESFGWKEGLYRKLKEARAFYGVIIVSMLVGFGINIIGLDPIKVLIYSAVANGLVAPVVIVLILLLSSNRQIMGERVNGGWAKFFGWLIIGLMGTAGLVTIWALLTS